MASLIRRRFNAVHNVVVDPSPELLQMYEGLVRRMKNDFDGIEFDFRKQTIDEYRDLEKKSGLEPSKYHFISAMHSLYYVDDYVSTVRYLYDCLEEGGILMIVCMASKFLTGPLFNRFLNKVEIIIPATLLLRLCSRVEYSNR